MPAGDGALGPAALDRLLRRVAELTCVITGADGAVLVVDVDDGRCATGAGALSRFGPSDLAPDGLLLRALETGRAVVADLEGGELPGEGAVFRAAAAVPIRDGGRAVGCVGVASATPGSFGPDRLALLDSVARLVEVGVAAVALARSEEELRRRLDEGDELYRAVLDSLDAGVLVLAEEEGILAANARAAEVLGVDPAELAGPGGAGLGWDAVAEDGAALAFEDFPAFSTLRTGEEVTGAVVGLRQAGDPSPHRWLSVTTRLLGAGTAPRRVVASITDITAMVAARDSLRRREAEFRLLAEHSADVISRHLADGTILYVSPAVEGVLGYAPEQLVGRTARPLWHPDDWPQVRGVTERAVAGERVPPVELRMLHRNGRTVYVELAVSAVRRDGRVEIVGATRDVTDRRRAEVQLESAQRQFRTAFVEAPVGMVIGRLAPDLQILQANEAFCRLVARPAAEVVGLDWRQLTHPGDWAREESAYLALASGQADTVELEKRFQRPDGGAVWGMYRGTTVSDGDGRGPLLIGQVVDVTARKEAEAQLAHQALHDPLTDLPNRALLLDRAGHALERGAPVAVVVVDLDRFKAVNDLLGHEAGDRLLLTLASRLGACLRPGDTLARFGGDEFVALAEEVADESVAVALAHRLRDAVVEPVEVSGTEVLPSASVGLALSRPGASAEAVVRDADAAAALAKERGGGRVEVFHADVRDRARARLDVAAGLRRALERDELRLHYQPEVDLRTGALACFEALVRWEHPERGLLPPAEFMPVAEESGLVGAIGGWVLDQAAAQLAAWRRRHPHMVEIGMAVNVSARQLADPGLVEQVEAAVRRLPGGAPLCLEVTESALLELPGARDALGQLKRHGVLLGIDDFGTSYSSLAYVARLAPDFLKVDRSFVEGLGRDQHDTAIVGAVVGLAHSLGLFVVAEGVEEDRQLAHLRALRCDLAQGFRLSRPLAPDDLEDVVAGRRTLL